MVQCLPHNSSMWMQERCPWYKVVHTTAVCGYRRDAHGAGSFLHTCRVYMSGFCFYSSFFFFFVSLLILRGQIFQAAYWNCGPQSQCELMKGSAYWGFWSCLWSLDQGTLMSSQVTAGKKAVCGASVWYCVGEQLSVAVCFEQTLSARKPLPEMSEFN